MVQVLLLVNCMRILLGTVNMGYQGEYYRYLLDNRLELHYVSSSPCLQGKVYTRYCLHLNNAMLDIRLDLQLGLGNKIPANMQNTSRIQLVHTFLQHTLCGG